MHRGLAVCFIGATLLLVGFGATVWVVHRSALSPHIAQASKRADALPPWFTTVDEIRSASKGIPEAPRLTGKSALIEEARHRGDTDVKPEHVVVYVIDALRADRVAMDSQSAAPMPFLHELAREGVAFTHCFSNTTWTLPSVRAMLSGHREDTQVSVSRPGALSPGTKLLPEILGSHGWLTALVSESPFVDTPYGLGQGFDRVTQNYIPDMRGSGGFRSRDTSLAEWAFLAHYSDHATFLYVQTLETHEPYIVPQPFSGTKPLGPSPIAMRDAGYDNGTRFADHNLRLLVDMLKATGAFKDTLLIVTADHGEALSAEESFDGPGHGGTLCLAKVRIPLVIVWPRGIPKGQRNDANVQGLDLVPTILDFLGYEIPGQCEGNSLKPLLQGTQPGVFEERTLLLRGSSGGRLMAEDKQDDSVALVKHGWCLIRSGGCERLYAAEESNAVSEDRSKDEPEQARALRDELDKALGTQPVPPARQAVPNAPNPAEEDRTRRDALTALGYL